VIVVQFAAGFLPRSLCERHVDEAVNTRRAKNAKVLYTRDPGHVVESNAVSSEIRVPDMMVTSRASPDQTPTRRRHGIVSSVGTRVGSVIVTVVPTPTALSTAIIPPCCSTIALLPNSPNPVPATPCAVDAR